MRGMVLFRFSDGIFCKMRNETSLELTASTAPQIKADKKYELDSGFSHVRTWESTSLEKDANMSIPPKATAMFSKTTALSKCFNPFLASGLLKVFEIVVERRETAKFCTMVRAAVGRSVEALAQCLEMNSGKKNVYERSAKHLMRCAIQMYFHASFLFILMGRDEGKGIGTNLYLGYTMIPKAAGLRTKR